ncbi:AI-2E family transporter [Frondihabitans cladoniiphilus]|uniref:AI-2E family transporter n=1 Tax=Frondihabitans cladoniiphilus TaxID=715785 RepID=A0ABP8VP68_9MICO
MPLDPPPTRRRPPGGAPRIRPSSSRPRRIALPARNSHDAQNHRGPRDARPRPVALQAFRVGLVGVLGVGLGLAIIGGVQTIASLLTYIGVAYFISLALEPVIVWAGRHRIPRWGAVSGVFAILVALAAALVFTVVPLVGHQIVGLAKRTPAALETLTSEPWFADLTKSLGVDGGVHGLVEAATDFLKDPAHLRSIGGGLLSVGTGVVDGATAVFVVLILTAYFTSTLPRITNKAFQMIPASKAVSYRPVYDEMTHSVGRYVAGQVLLAAFNALLTCILLLVFQVPGVALLTAVAFVGALIPIVGTIVEALIIIAVCLFTSPAAAIAAIIFYLVYHPLEAYILTPRVMSRAVHVPGALVVIAVIGGGALGGILGALVAVPIVAAAVVLVERVIVPFQRRR